MKKLILLFLSILSVSIMVFSQSAIAIKSTKESTTQEVIPDTEKKAIIKIYPNPASQYVTVDLGNWNTRGEIKFYYISGSEAMRSEISGMESKVDISSLREGLYFYEILSQGKLLEVGKIIKKNNIGSGD